MLQEANRALTLDEMMEAIRQEIRQRRSQDRSGAPLQAGASLGRWSAGQPVNTADWSRVEQNLNVADQFAPISSLQPQFVEWGKYRRTIALGVARGVMYVSRFITNKQARFNESLLAAVRELATQVRGLLDREAELAATVREHEARLQSVSARAGDMLGQAYSRQRAALEEKIAALQRSLADTQAELAALREATARAPAGKSAATEKSKKPATRSRKRLEGGTNGPANS